MSVFSVVSQALGESDQSFLYFEPLIQRGENRGVQDGSTVEDGGQYSETIKSTARESRDMVCPSLEMTSFKYKDDRQRAMNGSGVDLNMRDSEIRLKPTGRLGRLAHP